MRFFFHLVPLVVLCSCHSSATSNDAEPSSSQKPLIEKGEEQASIVEGSADEDTGKTWTDIHGKDHRLLELEKDEGLVMVFITVDCPIANQCQPTLRTMIEEFEEFPVRFALVHVDPDVTAEMAREHAEAYDIRCPVFLDPHHQLVSLTGVTITPEAALMSSSSEWVYRGRIDDRYAELGLKRRAATSEDLREAIRAFVEGREIENPRTEAIGCFIPDPAPDKDLPDSET